MDKLLIRLQVDKWNDCPSKPSCIIVNIGDALQYWSDGLLKSNFHRVRLPREGEPLVCHSLLDVLPDLHQYWLVLPLSHQGFHTLVWNQALRGSS